MAQEITRIDEIRLNVNKLSPQFKNALPAHIPVERFQRVAMTAISSNPRLAECNASSLYAACMQAAQQGLLPDGREGAIVSFKGVAKFMPMIAGILKKIRNSGELKSIDVEVVRDTDEFRYWVDDSGKHVAHTPDLDGTGRVVRVYAVALTKDGGRYIDVMTVADVEKVRAVSRSKDEVPWVQWWDEMAKKTVVRRLSKYLPQSTDVEGMWNEDPDARPDDDPPPVRDTQPAPPTRPTGLDAVAERGRQGRTLDGDQAAPGEAEESPEIEPRDDDLI